jgi:OOP family OmpA-OmpF porin
MIRSGFALALSALSSCQPPAPPEAHPPAPAASVESVTVLPLLPSSSAPRPVYDGDRDRDGVTDSRDACPTAAGGMADGCPAHVRFHADHVELLTPLEFEIGKPQLHERASPVIDELAAMLNAHLEIESIEIQGHYPSPEHAALNLSQRRAQSVMQALVKRGVDAKRLQAKGYGGDVPLESPKTEAGRAKNRRTEIRFIQR